MGAPQPQNQWDENGAYKTAAVLKALKGIFSGKGGLGDRKRPTAGPAKKKSNAR